jgi:undecaprenyl-diphosphatase
VEIQDKKIEKPNTLFLVYLMISTGVTFGCYLLFKDTIDILYKNPSILSGAYVITSIILFSTFFVRSSDKHVTVGQRGFLLPLVVGILQGLAILPGISRSGATISPLLHWRIHREDAAFYSFSLAVPAITGAWIFELFELESIHFLKEFWFMVIISFIASVFFSIIFLSLLRLLLVRDKFWMFSIYTLGLAIAAFMVFK